MRDSVIVVVPHSASVRAVGDVVDSRIAVDRAPLHLAGPQAERLAERGGDLLAQFHRVAADPAIALAHGKRGAASRYPKVMVPLALMRSSVGDAAEGRRRPASRVTPQGEKFGLIEVGNTMDEEGLEGRRRSLACSPRMLDRRGPAHPPPGHSDGVESCARRTLPPAASNAFPVVVPSSPLPLRRPLFIEALS